MSAPAEWEERSALQPTDPPGTVVYVSCVRARQENGTDPPLAVIGKGMRVPCHYVGEEVGEVG